MLTKKNSRPTISDEEENTYGGSKSIMLNHGQYFLHLLTFEIVDSGEERQEGDDREDSNERDYWKKLLLQQYQCRREGERERERGSEYEFINTFSFERERERE